MIEKTGKRNLCYNIRHRQYDWKDTMMDIDCVEYDEHFMPLAFVETKFPYGDIDLNLGQFTLLCNMARGELPVFCLVYYPLDINGNFVDAGHESDMVHLQFIVTPVNNCAKEYVAKQTKMTELEWVKILAKIHGHAVDDESKYYQTWKPVKNIPFIIPRID